MRRQVNVVLAGAAVVLALVGVVWAASGDDRLEASSQRAEVTRGERPATPEPERRELYGAVTVAVENEVWTFGGVSGPDGSSPPSTSMVPPGWTSNDLVLAYDADGTELVRLELEDMRDRTLAGGSVIAVGADRYVLSSACSGVSVGCSSSFEPFLVRVRNGAAERVDLRLPPGGQPSDIGDGFLVVLGQTQDGLVWVSQDVPNGTMLPVSQTRLLAIDVRTGIGTQIDLPDGLVNQGTVCMTDSHVFATQASLGGSALNALRVVRRPVTTASAEWEVVVEPDVDVARVYGGALACLPHDELALVVTAYPHGYVLTYSADTGGDAGGRFDLPPDGGRILAELDDRTVLGVRTGRDVLGLVVHQAGGPWIPTGGEIALDSVPVVLHGELRDASAAGASTRPSQVNFPLIDLDA